MSYAISMEVICPQGHLLRAPERAAGKTLPCPICRDMVSVKPKTSVSESGLLRAMNDRIAEIASRHKPVPAAAEREALSDTSVMRILGECLPPPPSSDPVESRSSRACPRCAHDVPESLSICQNCSGYLGPPPDYFREIAGHAQSQIDG